MKGDRIQVVEGDITKLNVEKVIFVCFGKAALEAHQKVAGDIQLPIG